MRNNSNKGGRLSALSNLSKVLLILIPLLLFTFFITMQDISKPTYIYSRVLSKARSITNYFKVGLSRVSSKASSVMNQQQKEGIGILIAFSIVFITIITLFLMPFSTEVFSAGNDTFWANVTVTNSGPVVSNVMFNDTDASDVNITLTAGSPTNLIMCNATITDQNGYQDVSASGSVNATFYHITSSVSSADNNNTHYTNTSCSFTGGSGTTVTALCTVMFQYFATNGTWTCNVSAKDGSSAVNTSNNSNQVEQLVALYVNETNISFGSLGNGQNSSSAQSTNTSNQGNVKIDIQVKGNTDMNCSTLGNLGVTNISYNYTSGNYDSMYAAGAGKILTTSLATMSAFNLVSTGTTPFVANQPASNLTYWTIQIPSGVKGTCNNTLTVAAIISTD